MRLLAVLFFVACLAAAPVAHAAGDCTAEKNYVDHVAGQALQIIKDTRAHKLTPDVAKVKFREILNKAFDLQTIARFTLGRYWRVATPAEQREFSSLLQKVILNKYADRLLEFSGDKYTVDGARPTDGGDTIVNSTIFPSDKPPVAFDWRLRKSASGLKIIDLNVEGISMSVTHRTDFANTIEANGGKVSALIEALKNKE